MAYRSLGILRSSLCALAVCLLLQPTLLGQDQQANFQTAALQSKPDPYVQISPELRGDLLTARQRYLDAIAAYRQGPHDSAVLCNKIGVAYHHMFNIVEAKKYYEQALKLNPRYPEALNNLGAIYHTEKNYKQAERCYKKAIKLDPHSPMYYSNLGTAYFFQGNVKRGAEAYRTALTLDPEVFEHGTASRIEEASSTKALATVNYFLARTYAQAGKNDRALYYLRKAIEEGFNDRKKLMGDEQFASLRETPEFAKLLNKERMQR